MAEAVVSLPLTYLDWFQIASSRAWPQQAVQLRSGRIDAAISPVVALSPTQVSPDLSISDASDFKEERREAARARRRSSARHAAAALSAGVCLRAVTLRVFPPPLVTPWKSDRLSFLIPPTSDLTAVRGGSVTHGWIRSDPQLFP